MTNAGCKCTNAIKILIFILMIIVFPGCYYDNEEHLYPAGSGSPCNTTNVTYGTTVAPILSSNCNGCHNPSSPLGGIVVSDYNNLKIQVQSGKFWGSINHDTGFSKMPKGGSKLSDCSLSKIKAWIDAGALNN